MHARRVPNSYRISAIGLIIVPSTRFSCRWLVAALEYFVAYVLIEASTSAAGGGRALKIGCVLGLIVAKDIVCSTEHALLRVFAEIHSECGTTGTRGDATHALISDDSIL